MTTVKSKPQGAEVGSGVPPSETEVRLRRSRKKAKRSSVVFADEKTAAESSLSKRVCLLLSFLFTLLFL